MRISSYTEEYLNRVYGWHWQTIGETPPFDHETNENMEYTIFNITSSPRLFGPAIPFPSQFRLKRPFWNKITLDNYKRKYISTYNSVEFLYSGYLENDSALINFQRSWKIWRIVNVDGFEYVIIKNVSYWVMKLIPY